MTTAQEWYVRLLGRPDMGWNVDMTQKEYHDHISKGRAFYHKDRQA